MFQALFFFFFGQAFMISCLSERLQCLCFGQTDLGRVHAGLLAKPIKPIITYNFVPNL